MNTIFEELRNYCPSGFVARKDIYKLTGGLINPGTIANLDSKGIGIPNKSKIGKQVVYQIDDVISWLDKNTKILVSEKT